MLYVILTAYIGNLKHEDLEQEEKGEKKRTCEKKKGEKVDKISLCRKFPG